MSTKPTFVDFDQLIYLQFDHAPGYAQWWVMLNLGSCDRSRWQKKFHHIAAVPQTGGRRGV